MKVVAPHSYSFRPGSGSYFQGSRINSEAGRLLSYELALRSGFPERVAHGPHDPQEYH